MISKAQYSLKQLVENYNINNNVPISFDFNKACRHSLNSKFGKDNRYMQYIHYYPGRIYPYIPLYLLSLDELTHLNGYLLDPFAGSGTILLESIINPVLKRSSLGVEINPLARLISKVKTTPIDVSKILKLMLNIHKLYSQSVDAHNYVPAFENIDLWFSQKAVKQLAKLKFAIEKLDISADYKDFFCVCFSSIIRKVSRSDPNIPPPVILKLYKYKNIPPEYQKLRNFLRRAEDPDVWNLFENTVKNNMLKLDYLNSLEELRNGKIKSEIIWDDARNIKKGSLVEYGKIEKGSTKQLLLNGIDIIFTSPPYLTAQKYIRTSKLELFWLGYSQKEVQDLDKMSIGTERVSSRTEIKELGITDIDSLIDRTFSRSKERGLMVYKYFENMLVVLKEMHRFLNKDGYAILVVGDNKVLGKKVNTYRLLTDAAINLGFKEIVILKDEIKSRSMMTKRNGTGGLIKNEYIAILNKEAQKCSKSS